MYKHQTVCVCVSVSVSVCSAQPGAGHPLWLRVQLVDESQQLVESFVLIAVHDDGVKKVTAALLHLTCLLNDVTQLLRLNAHTYTQALVLAHKHINTADGQK